MASVLGYIVQIVLAHKPKAFERSSPKQRSTISGLGQYNGCCFVQIRVFTSFTDCLRFCVAPIGPKHRVPMHTEDARGPRAQTVDYWHGCSPAAITLMRRIGT